MVECVPDVKTPRERERGKLDGGRQERAQARTAR